MSKYFLSHRNMSYEAFRPDGKIIWKTQQLFNNLEVAEYHELNKEKVVVVVSCGDYTRFGSAGDLSLQYKDYTLAIWSSPNSFFT